MYFFYFQLNFLDSIFSYQKQNLVWEMHLIMVKYISIIHAWKMYYLCNLVNIIKMFSKWEIRKSKFVSVTLYPEASLFSLSKFFENMDSITWLLKIFFLSNFSIIAIVIVFSDIRIIFGIRKNLFHLMQWWHDK